MDKSYKTLGCQATPEMYETVKRIAKKEDRSISSVIRLSIEQFVSQYIKEDEHSDNGREH